MAEADKAFLPTHNEYIALERHVLQDNITLCDTKSGILLGFSALVILWCFDRLSEAAQHWSASLFLMKLEAILYGIAVLALLATIIFAWRVVKPRIRPSEDHIFWDSKIFRESETIFASRIQCAAPDALATDMLRHLHVLGGICREKFANFRRATISAQFSALIVFMAVCTRVAARLIDGL